MVKFFFALIFSFATLASTVSLESLFNEQVQDYKNKNWSKVYARGHFYRYKYLRNDEEVKAAFSPAFFKLEIYALAHKCQWSAVNGLFEDFLKFEKIKNDKDLTSKEIKDKIESFKAYKLVTKEISDDNLKKKNQSNSILVESIDWDKLQDLNDIEIEVEDLCQK